MTDNTDKNTKKEIRVRFAPSPTGNLHIGGARTALYNYLFAKKNNGKLVLRIEDTDIERSSKESEESIVNDLKWLGITFDEYPENGEYGPYRQSERLDIYKKIAQKLMGEDKAYACFLSPDELENLTKKAEKEKKPPHFYHDFYRNLDKIEAKKRIEAGDSYVIRFKNPQKTYTFVDLVRGKVSFGPEMVGDFVILRSSGMPVYNFSCAIDDMQMKISHVFRAEEHLPNTLRQLMIYESLNVEAPIFGHCSLLVGKDRQKLSKRHAATSVKQYRDMGFLSQSLNNYLCLLGWSHPDEKDIFTMDEIINIFETSRFNKAPALFDLSKLKFFNEQHMKRMNQQDLTKYVENFLNDKSENFKIQSEEWKNKFCFSFVEKVQLPEDYLSLLQEIFDNIEEDSDEYKEIFSWPQTQIIKDYLQKQFEIMASDINFVTISEIDIWMNFVKKELKIKGKFLFKGMRALLTGRSHGPDIKKMIELTPVSVLRAQLNKQ